MSVIDALRWPHRAAGVGALRRLLTAALIAIRPDWYRP
jgi:hypothetical protein